MPFDWKYYLSLAQLLHRDHSNNQAALRTAISRAYYAAYHPAKDWAVNQRGLDPKANHHEVWSLYLRDSNDRTIFEIGSHGDRLKRSRVHADYEPGLSTTTGDSARALATAEKILYLLGGL